MTYRERVEIGPHVLYLGDCREILPTLTADAVVTDPPYSFGMASTAHEGKAGGWGDMMNAAEFYSATLKRIRTATMRRRGCAWLFNSWRSFPILARAAFDAEWPITSLAVWDKEWIGPGGHAGLRPAYEVIALFANDGFTIEDRSVSDVIRSKWHPAMRQTEHPAEKPESLLARLVEISTHPGDSILDPFMGSGTTGVACAKLGRKFIGVEIHEPYFRIACRRIADAVNGGTQPELFA